MSVDLKHYFESEKLLARRSKWIQPDSENLRLSCPLDIDGITVAGLEFCAYATRQFHNEGVRLQLQYLPPKGRSYPFCRIDWKPFHEHCNNGRGPADLKLLRMTGSHIHSFELNFIPETDTLRQHNLPIAEPLTPDANSFEDLLDFTAKLFRIGNMDWVSSPPWQGKMI